MALIDKLKRWVPGSDSVTDTEGVTYACMSCSTTFDTSPGECPECGADEIRERGGPAGPGTDL